MKTVLIIQNNADIRESCCNILNLSGYHVLQSDCGKSGVKLATQHQPDLILCDIVMPDLDGYGIFYLLSKNKITAEIPFIFLTATADRIDYRKAMEMGADDYLTKPFDDVELLHAIEARINKCQRQKVLYSSTFQNLEQLSSDAGDGVKELKELINDLKIKRIKKKQVLYDEGDNPPGLYLIVDGKLKTVKRTLDGRQLITGLYKADDYMGLNAVLLDEAFTESAEATENASLYLLPKELLINLLNKYPEVSRQFIKMLSNEIHEKEEQLLELAYLSVRKRIAQVLLRLSRKSPVASMLDISREELAALAGVAIETVSRTLSDFKEEGFIEKNGNQVELIDIARITKIKS